MVTAIHKTTLVIWILSSRKLYSDRNIRKTTTAINKTTVVIRIKDHLITIIKSFMRSKKIIRSKKKNNLGR